MSNWYKNAQNPFAGFSRYESLISAELYLRSIFDKEEEKQKALKILQNAFKEIGVNATRFGDGKSEAWFKFNIGSLERIDHHSLPPGETQRV